ncbi:MAG: extracellular solute-binding protein [Deltaproteobacteria bacterium]|nr:extracellular solute-binding protein [Deltaproteobacteria bacterium]
MCPKAFILLLVALFFVSAHANADDAAILAAAKVEGEVIWYSGHNLSFLNTTGNAFEKKYPFIKVRVVRGSDEKMLNRISAEKKAGKILFDVVNGQLLPFIQDLGVLAPFRTAGTNLIEARFKDPQGYWAGVNMTYYVLSYNTTLVSKDEVPQDWQNLTNAKWKGKIGMDPEEYHWLGGMMEYLGEEKAKRLLVGIAQQQIRWHKGHNLLAQLTAAGELPLSLGYAHIMEQLKSKGAPVDWVRTTKPIIGGLSKVGLSSAPPHPNAARLMIDFLTSKEGQIEYLKAGYNPVLPGVRSKNSPLDPALLDLLAVSPAVILNLNQYARKFDQIFGPRG